jgi:hypothetical protein
MTYPVTKLINKAYYLSQVVGRELQTVSGSQFSDGLDLLNALLEVKGSDVRLIPYFTRYVFNTVATQEIYFIPNLVSIETLTFNIGPVQFPTTKVSRVEYFGSGKIDNVYALPFSWHAERVLDGMNIYLYFKPNATYEMRLTGKFGLTDVAANTDLQSVYDLFYIEYLRYALAEYICSDWGTNMPEQAANKFKEIRKKLQDISPPDLKLRKISTLRDNKSGDNTWGVINFSGGWFPVGYGG